MPGQTVLVDAQFGIAKILRPYTGFETDYQGKSVFDAIALTERGIALDPLAGKPGYAPNLLRGLPVSIGSRVMLWLPNVIGGNSLGAYAYRYSIGWRLRSTFDYRQLRGPYHYPKQGKGVPDTTAPPGKQDRVVKPAGWDTIVYSQGEPQPPPVFPSTVPIYGGVGDRAVGNMHAEDLAVRGGTLLSPLVPGGGPGNAQQGILNPGNVLFGATAVAPIYSIHEVQALGDELLLWVYRDVVSSGGGSNPNWDFTGAPNVDQTFSIYYGSGSGQAYPDLGVYVMTGAAT